MAADPLTPAKGNTPAREISPLRGKGLDRLTLALPYPSSPALRRKDTTYAWSYRLRCKHTRVMMRVMMLMVDNDVHDADIQRMMTQVLKLKMMIKKIMQYFVKQIRRLRLAQRRPSKLRAMEPLQVRRKERHGRAILAET